MEPIRPKGSKGFTTTPPPDRYISVQNVAETLGCTDKYVYDLIQEGRLKAIKIGVRALRVSERSLRDFITSNIVNPSDYFAPVERPQEPPSQKIAPEEPRLQRIARSNWMRR